MKKKLFGNIIVAALLAETVLGPGKVCQGANENVHETGNYQLQITPHAGLGKFKLQHDPDKPLMATYGGIGLRRTEEGKWSSSKITQRSDVDRLISKCVQNGINILCPNLFYQGMPSKLMAPLPEGFEDLFPYFLEQAHRNNIQVNLCVPVFCLRWQEKPFIDVRHKEMFIRERNGTAGSLPSSAVKKFRDYRLALILECCERYPLDGIQLDFIRWESFSHDRSTRDLLSGYGVYGYEKNVLEALRSKHKLAHDFVPTRDDPRFVQAKQKYISSFLEELRAALKANDIALPIGVYNSSSYGRISSLRQVHQDWKYWEDHGLVDIHQPMFYMDSFTRYARALKSLVDVKNEKSVVLGPLFLDGGYVPTQAMCGEAARRAIKLGCDGLWICRPMEVERYELWPAIKEVSEYSISKIRAADFDPLYENIISNGAFESAMQDWEVNPSGAAHVVSDDLEPTRSALRVDLTSDEPIEIVHQPIQLLYRVCDIRSSGFSFAYRSTPSDARERAQVEVLFKYTDGYNERRSFQLDYGQSAWTRKSIEFPFVRTAETKVRSATLRIRVPQGDGTIWLDSFELTYDPLHNPLEME